jgi:hypothetical protein
VQTKRRKPIEPNITFKYQVAGASLGRNNVHARSAFDGRATCTARYSLEIAPDSICEAAS